jgi:hypothetical protein
VQSLRNNAIGIYDQRKQRRKQKKQIEDTLDAQFHSRLCIASFHKFKAVRDALPNPGDVISSPGADNENKKRNL